jgi:ABC-2 type transport system ATP-binding protein
MTAVIETRSLSKWYGNVLGLSDVSLSIEPGVIGLLGPNGAGKSTFLKLITGQLKPSIGGARVFGQIIWNNPKLFSRIGFCPEADAFFEDLTGWEFLVNLLRLHGFPGAEAKRRSERALEIVELVKDKDRLIRAYSRGMRQRLKFAQAIAHDPEVIILDEPMSGLDPLGKRKFIRLIRDYRGEGRTIIVSSHVLPEIEALTKNIILIHQGKILATGDIHDVRELIERHPHIISLRVSDRRRLAGRLVKEDFILDVRFEKRPDTLVIETRQRDKFFSLLPALVLEEQIEVEEITSPDDNLQAVFDYLVGK